MDLLKLLALALGPIAFIFTYVYLRDRFDREPLRYLIVTFICGILIAIPVIFLGKFLGDVLGVSDTSGSPADLAIYAFGVVALSEEGMKYLVLRWYNYPHREFNEPYDGIMYGVAVSLGFAAIENVLYVFTSEYGVSTAIIRMFTAVPAHASFGVMMGFFVGRAKFISGINPFTERMKGLLTAIFFHGLYDYFLFLGVESLAIISFIGLGLTIFLARRAIRLHAADSERRNRRSVRNPFFDPD
ncbi:MAG: protease PrsW [Bacteroidetes bacterium]|nr:MAG: protease PrsW [Bacteroidota bacterium]